MLAAEGGSHASGGGVTTIVVLLHHRGHLGRQCSDDQDCVLLNARRDELWMYSLKPPSGKARNTVHLLQPITDDEGDGTTDRGWMLLLLLPCRHLPHRHHHEAVDPSYFP